MTLLFTLWTLSPAFAWALAAFLFVRSALLVRVRLVRSIGTGILAIGLTGAGILVHPDIPSGSNLSLAPCVASGNLAPISPSQGRRDQFSAFLFCSRVENIVGPDTPSIPAVQLDYVESVMSYRILRI